MSGDEVVELEVYVYAESARAILAARPAETKADAQWVPKSLIDGEVPGKDSEGSILLKAWKARQLGWE